jgi:hypothetical protein
MNMAHPLLKKTRRNRPVQTRRSDAPLPHPSWRVAGASPDGSAQTLTAGDFWDRLGL